MKFLKYSLLLAASAMAFSACDDDPVLGNPVMDVKTDISEAHFGDSLRFVINASDAEVPLSTIHATLYYDSEKVEETVIRTKVSGKDYEGTIYLPYFANVPDGNATLRLSLQNTQFTITERDYKLHITHADYPYLTLVANIDEGGETVQKEYRMTKKEKYVYAFTDKMPQKFNGKIIAPKVGDNGNELVFGFLSNNVTIGGDGDIPFSNTKAGRYEVSFNTFSFTAAPYLEMKIGGADPVFDSETISHIDLNLEPGQTISLQGFSNLGDWWIDPDYFTLTDDGSLKFVPMAGMYRIIIDQKLQYFRVYAIDAAGNPLTLNNDGSGALWIIGDNIGKPSVSSNLVGWTTENALCMAQIREKVYQVTLVGGKTVSTNSTNFKFFGQMGWGVELKGSANFAAVYSDLIGVGDGNGHDDGNLYLLDGCTLKDNEIYTFTVDLSGGLTAATLTVEDCGEQPFEEKRVSLNGVKMTTNDNAGYHIAINLSQGSALTFDGAAVTEEYYVDPDYFTYNADTDELYFNPVDGNYEISLNVKQMTLGAKRLNSDGSEATFEGDGHGIWLMGWGVGSPSMDNQFGWTPGAAYCVAEVQPGIYWFTGNAGPENGSQIGDRFRTDYLSFKFFYQDGWGGEFSGANALSLTGTASDFIKDAGNFELAGGVSLEQGATYRLIIDANARTIDMVKL